MGLRKRIYGKGGDRYAPKRETNNPISPKKYDEKKRDEDNKKQRFSKEDRPLRGAEKREGKSTYADRKDSRNDKKPERKFGPSKEGRGGTKAPRKYSTGHSRNLKNARPEKTGESKNPKSNRYNSSKGTKQYEGDKHPAERKPFARKPFEKNEGSERKYANDKTKGRYPSRENTSEEKSFRTNRPERINKYAKPEGRFSSREERRESKGREKSDERKTNVGRGFNKNRSDFKSFKKDTPVSKSMRFEKKVYPEKTSEIKGKRTFEKKNKRETEAPPDEGNIRLNRYISNAGISSRREADKLIGAGLVSVNGQVITEMGYQVKQGDDVRYNGTRLSTEAKVYLMMNKPKDMITTLDDPDGRRIVTDLIKNEDLPRVYPVGRLDRNTTGVLLLTNDGEMAQRLMHPKFEVQKIYKATLDKNFKGEDLWTLTNGVELEDGFIKPDSIAIPDPSAKNEIVIEIHSGRNRIIHRMFGHLGYSLEKLDRLWYAGLNKKSLKRGEWKHLEERELKTLKKLVKLK